jgi:hypothetical protein
MVIVIIDYLGSNLELSKERVQLQGMAILPYSSSRRDYLLKRRLRLPLS